MYRSDSESKYRDWKTRNAPYLLAMALAFVMVMVVAPEVNEGDAMAPTIEDGQVLVVSKTSYSAKRKIPERDQLVILEKTAAQDVSEDNIIARVAGLPGETVQIKNGQVLVDGEEYVTENGIKGAGGDMTVKLKKNQVFLLCDNREATTDSRNKGLGPVDMGDIKGNVLICVWPFSQFGGID